MVKYKKVKREDIFHKDYEIALDFATQTYKQFSEIIKTIVLFGSVSKQEAQKKSDIDLIIIIDDCTIEWDQELIAWYRTELGKLISKQRYKDNLHINTITLSTFWEELKAGEPLIINVLRYGQTLIDFGGFFEPLKILLAKGRIRSTPEAVFTTMKRAPEHLLRSNASLLGTIEGFYWAVVDASHAALMAINEIPPSPEHISNLLREHFILKKQLDKRYAEYYDEIYILAKKIVHGEVNRVDGKRITDLQKKAEDFVKTLRDLTQYLIKEKKIIRVERRPTL